MKPQNSKEVLQIEHQSEGSMILMNKKIESGYKSQNQIKELQNIIKLNNQEIQTLQYMVGFKDQAL